MPAYRGCPDERQLNRCCVVARKISGKWPSSRNCQSMSATVLESCRQISGQICPKTRSLKKTCGLVAPPSECALILYRCRRFINHLLTYLLTYLANANEVSGSKSGVPDTTCCYVTVTYKSSVDFVDEAFRSQLQQVLCILWTCCPYQTAVTV